MQAEQQQQRLLQRREEHHTAVHRAREEEQHLQDTVKVITDITCDHTVAMTQTEVSCDVLQLAGCCLVSSDPSGDVDPS